MKDQMRAVLYLNKMECDRGYSGFTDYTKIVVLIFSLGLQSSSKTANGNLTTPYCTH